MLSQKSLTFLKQLSNNNNRDWFNAHKADYESLIRSPTLKYISEMGDLLPQISTQLTAVPKKIGGSMMRPYRDVRFSKDKTPYKTNIGVQFRHQLGKNVHAPSIYLNITADACFIGMGMWRPDSAGLRRIRHFIVDNPNYWVTTKQQIQQKTSFGLTGDRLIRPPQGFDKDHKLIEDLKYKDFIIALDIPVKETLKDDFSQISMNHFLQGKDYLEWLCDAAQVPF